MPHSWKTGQRPSAAYGPGTLAIGLRIVYTGKKAKKFPRASHQPHLLDVNQRAVLLDDLAHLGRKIGGANPRKDDTQVSGFMAGCVEVVWPDLRKYTARYEGILSEMAKLDTLPEAYLSERSMSCLIVYALPPETTSLSNYQPWDRLCLLVADSATVDSSLAMKCRAFLRREPRLDQALARNQSFSDNARDHPDEERVSRPPGSVSTKARSYVHHTRSTSIGHFPRRGLVRSPSPMSTTRIHSRSRSRSRSPPRKRLKYSANEDRRGMLLETISKLCIECDEVYEREDALRHKLDLITDERKSLAILEQQVEAWTSKAERAEGRVREQQCRLRLLLDNHAVQPDSTGAPTILADDASPLLTFEAVMRDYKLRGERAGRDATYVKDRYVRRMVALNGRGSPLEGNSLADALSAVAELAASIGV